MTDGSDRCLIVVLKEEVELLLARECPERSFTVNNTVFKDVGYGDFLGFYDWLRNTQQRVVGVRHHVFDEFKLPFGRFKELPYAEVFEYPKVFSLSLYFGADRDIEEQSSDDQCFTDNRVYRSELDEYAISFSVEDVINTLSDEALQKCRRIEER